MVATDKLRQEAREALTAVKKQPVTKDVLLTRPAGVIMQVAVAKAVELLQNGKLTTSSQAVSLFSASHVREVSQKIKPGDVKKIKPAKKITWRVIEVC